MQSGTLVALAIAALQGKTQVVEERWNKETRTIRQVVIPVVPALRAGSYRLQGDRVYYRPGNVAVVRVHARAGKLLVVIAPFQQQFTLGAADAARKAQVPYIHAPTDGNVRAWFDNTIWMDVRNAVRARSEWRYLQCMGLANKRVAEREIYRQFFDKPWPPVIAAAPAELDAWTTRLARQKVEGFKNPLSDWQARYVGDLDPRPFWIKAEET